METSVQINRQVLDEFKGTLPGLRESIKQGPADFGRRIGTRGFADPENKRVFAVLSKPVDLEFKGSPLAASMKWLEKKSFSACAAARTKSRRQKVQPTNTHCMMINVTADVIPTRTLSLIVERIDSRMAEQSTAPVEIVKAVPNDTSGRASPA